ncbi:MAG: hypothetical protein HY769_01210 [Candidatus Stahlbacteria bacterium]|nr:hypothetical protein [Candidatus Stahlbacteria bacterium]
MSDLKETFHSELQVFLLELIRRIDTYRDKGISEADTKAKLIEPLFEKLRWDIRSDEVIRAYNIQSSLEPIDYLFKINDEPRLLIGAKKLGDPITIKDITQAIEYGNIVGIKWCIVTDGNEIRVYNSMWPESIENKLFFSLSITTLAEGFDEKFSNFFDTIRLLSRESVDNNELDKEGTREYSKRVVLEIWKEDMTTEFICDRAKFKKLKSNIVQQAIKELEVQQLFPFPIRLPEEALLQESQSPKEEIIPDKALIPDKETIILPEQIVTLLKIPAPDKIVSGFITHIQETAIREAFKTTMTTFRKLGKDVVEEVQPKSIVYKLKGKVFLKLKPSKVDFQIEVLNPPTGKWLSFDIEKSNLNKLKDRINRVKNTYKQVRKK